jgi:hypothetical protein
MSTEDEQLAAATQLYKLITVFLASTSAWFYCLALPHDCIVPQCCAGYNRWLHRVTMQTPNATGELANVSSCKHGCYCARNHCT